jgi:WD40 repeat protein
VGKYGTLAAILLALVVAAGSVVGWMVWTEPPRGEAQVTAAPRPAAAVPVEAVRQCGAIEGVPVLETTPQLRVEPGGHTSLIAAMAVAPGGKTLVTGGWDKTIRVWSLETADGKPRTEPMLRDTLVVPMGEERTGESYAIAISPDASLIAVGGRMSSEAAPRAERIYVFDALTARIAAVLPVASQVNALAWSPDGRHLAAGTGRGVGLCVWSARNWVLAGQDPAYAGSIHGLAYSTDGKLAATGADGALRIYEGSFEKPARRHAFPADAAARQPFGVTFSPNGRYIAVGFYNAGFISLHETQDPGVTTRLQAADDGGLPFVTWSRDGQRLYAAGSALPVAGTVKAKTRLHAWTANEAQPLSVLGAARATSQAVEGASGPVQALAALSGSDIAMATRDGDIMGLRADGTATFRRTSARLDWRVAEWKTGAAGFRLSPDATSVSVRLDDGRVVRFDMARRNTAPRSFIAPAGSDQDLAGPQLELGGKTISLADPQAPVLVSADGAAPVEWILDTGERAISHAASTQAGAFVLGTNHRLRIADAQGKERRSVYVPETVERVAISRDGRLVVAAIGDATLRWYRIGRDENSSAWTLEPMLALYLDADGRRWIAWTPQGHYDAAAGAEELVSWRVNRGADRNGLNVSVGRFRDLYRRSDIIDRALTEASAAPDASRLLAASPPVIRVTGWRQLANFKLELDYELDWLSGPQREADHVTAFVGASSQQAARGFTAVQSRRTVAVDVPPGSGVRRIELRARVQGGLASDPAILEVPPVASPPPVSRKLHAVIVGVSAYPSLAQTDQLQFADDDARVLAQILQRQAGPGRLYASATVNPRRGRALVDADATRRNILDELGAIASDPQDLAILFLAGHGTVARPAGSEGETSLFLPHDARMAGGRLDTASAISVDEITKAFFNPANRGRKLVFIDACRSGNFARNNGNLLAAALKDNRADVAVWSSATAEQLAFESTDYGGGHGAFTAALIEAFRGKPDFARILENPERFSESELNLWIERRVPRIAGTDADGNPRQTPERMLAGVGGDIATIVP